jgi:hypothetical protein
LWSTLRAVKKPRGAAPKGIGGLVANDLDTEKAVGQPRRCQLRLLM